MAKQVDVSQLTPKVAGLDPDKFVQAGLPDDFSGTITNAGYAPFNYDGKRQNYIFAAFVDYTPDPASGLEPFRQWYSVSSLEKWIPSNDQQTPAGPQGTTYNDYLTLHEGEGEIPKEELHQYTGRFALTYTVDPPELPKGSNWEDYLTKLALAGHPKLTTTDIHAIIGAHGQFKRLPQKERSGVDSQGKTILVCINCDRPGTGRAQVAAPTPQTQAAPAVTAAPSPAPAPAQAASTPAPAPAAAAPVATGGVDATLESMIVSKIAESGGTWTPDNPAILQMVQSVWGPNGSAPDGKAFTQTVANTLGTGAAAWLSGRSSFKYNPANRTFSL